MISLMRALGAAALLVTSIAPLAAQPAPAKIAFVDTRKILDQAPGRAEAEAVLQKEYTSLQEQLKKMNDAIVKAFGDYQSLAPTTPQAEKDKRLKLVQDKQTEMQQKQQEFDNQLTTHKEELLQPLLDQIKIVLEDLRVEGGWTYIMEAGQGGAIVAADKNLDLSDRAIAKLRTMPKPVIAVRSDSGSAGAKKPAGAPLNSPSGVRAPGTPAPPAAKKPDTTATKKPDSTATKKPAEHASTGSMSPAA